MSIHHSNQRMGPLRPRRLAFSLLVALLGSFGCDDQIGLPHAGVFLDSPVSGLDYKTATSSGLTGDLGVFRYRDGETVSFSIGALDLGSAVGAETLTPLGITSGATEASDPAVNNKLILLQTLDADGDLNNGIQITEAIRAIVSAKAATIAFSQPTTAFRTSLTDLMTELNGAGAFTDTDPRPRAVRTAAAALQHFARSTSERKVVVTQYGAISGYSATDSTWQFLGIPYAKPPLGGLRWKPPVPPAPWAGVRHAVAWSDQAAQDPLYQASGEGGMSEDCLYLNVTTPKKASRLPVMVWFHGGAFTILTGNTKQYNNPEALPAKGVVLVTVNHRLGPFGYLAHPLLVADSTYGGSGNYGQMDLVMALTWVKQNIAHFGGDPGNVTIFGQSGGGGKVASLMTSPMAAGLFQKAVCQSGTSPLAPTSTKESVIASAEAVGISLFTRMGITSIEQARALPWTAFVQSDIDAKVSREVYRPTVDNHYVSKTFYGTIMDGQPSDVPLMLGATSGDYPTIIKGLQENVPFRATYGKAKLFAYRFSRVPAGWASLGLASGHGGELPYLFDYPAGLVSNFQYGLVLDPSTGAKPVIGDLDGNGVTGTAGDVADILASAGWNADDSAIGETTMTLWANFARTGDPSTSALTWPAFTTTNDTYVEIGPGAAASVKTGLATAF